jgi:hypothetical protein
MADALIDFIYHALRINNLFSVNPPRSAPKSPFCDIHAVRLPDDRP